MCKAGDPAGKSAEDTANARANGHAEAEFVDTSKAEEAAAAQGSDLSTTVTHESGLGISLVEEDNQESSKKHEAEDVVVLLPISPFKANSQKARHTPKKDEMSSAGRAVRTPNPENK